MPERRETLESTISRARASLTGPEVRLRELREADLPTLVAWWRDPEVAVFNDHVQPRPDKPLEEQFRTWANNGSSAGATFCVETLAGVLIGHVALWGAELRNRCATFGILIGPEHQSRRLGTQATRLMVDYGFAELGLHRIELAVNAENVRAVSAYERAGFEREGLLRSKLFYGGCFHDQVVMGALAPGSAVQDGRELLDAVDEAGAGTGPGRIGVDRMDPYASR